jgi:hypothetical protein
LRGSTGGLGEGHLLSQGAELALVLAAGEVLEFASPPCSVVEVLEEPRREEKGLRMRNDRFGAEEKRRFTE